MAGVQGTSMTEKDERLLKAATEINNGFIDDIAGSDGDLRAKFIARADERSSEAKRKGIKGLERHLRQMIRRVFEHLHPEVSQPLVRNALIRHGLSFEEFGFDYQKAVQKVLRRGRIKDDWEYYVLRAYVDTHEGDEVEAMFGMIDAYDMPK